MTVDGNPDPQPTLEEEVLTDLNQITPKKVSAKVRVGEPITFTLTIEPSANYPVDFYILMDLSATMDDDLNTLKKLALNICKFGKSNTVTYSLIHVVHSKRFITNMAYFCFGENLAELMPQK
ncbi:integrin beta-6 isoform X1 [Paramuricea clavata]|uniref:Integrin beta n=1 Tax=Paramuricea clavata TaxID=317549 RepID=A0A7D9LMW1_PARCT|nr:integrin beta-6 isoform X1 [Paramuricea clavata]